MKISQTSKKMQLGIALVSGLLLAPVFVFAQVAPDENPPIITLNGSNPMEVFQFDDFVDPLATAFDVEDDTTTIIEGVGFVDTETVGEYILTYTAFDRAQNEASTTRTVNVIARDTTAPRSTISTPVSDSTIEHYFITISGTTSDNVSVASTTIAFAPLLADGDFLYCDQYYEQIVSLPNTQGTNEFNWSYNWTPENGSYCIRVYGEDASGNFEREAPEVVNVNFTKKIDPVVTPTEPTPSAPDPIPGGRRHSITTPGEVLGASTQVSELKTVDIVWTTNVSATSGVIYGLTVAGPYNLNTNVTNFGYPFSSGENSQKVLNHKVSISGIVVGQSYSVRVVSSVTGPNFGPEYRFIINQDGTIKTQGGFGGELIIKNAQVGQETLSQFVKRNDPKVQVVMDGFLKENLKASNKSNTIPTSTDQLASAVVTTTEEFTWTGFINFLFGKLDF